MNFFSSKPRLVGLVSALLVVCGLLLTVLLGAYLVYIRRDGRPTVRMLAKSLPIASLGSQRISYGAFLSARDAVQVYLASDAAKQVGLNRPFGADLEKSVLDRLMREAAISDLAERRRISLPDAQVRVAFAELVLSTSSTLPNVAQYLEDAFHWTEEEYRQNILRPVLLEEHLAAAMASTTEASYAALDTAIRERLSKPDVKIYLSF